MVLVSLDEFRVGVDDKVFHFCDFINVRRSIDYFHKMNLLMGLC